MLKYHVFLILNNFHIINFIASYYHPYANSKNKSFHISFLIVLTNPFMGMTYRILMKEHL